MSNSSGYLQLMYLIIHLEILQENQSHICGANILCDAYPYVFDGCPDDQMTLIEFYLINIDAPSWFPTEFNCEQIYKKKKTSNFFSLFCDPMPI